MVHFRFACPDDLDQPVERTLIAQLTGRSANLFLLDARDTITHQLRPVRGAGLQVGEEYRLPGGGETRVRDRGANPTRSPQTRVRDRGTSPTPGSPTEHLGWRGAVREGSISETLDLHRSGQFGSLSEALDIHYNALLDQQAFDAHASAARAELRKRASRQQRLLKQLQADLAGHADAEQQKRLGDLLLANLSTARRSHNRVKLIDYFSADAPMIEIELDEKVTLPQEAERRFALYSRSKRAVRQINSRIEATRTQIAALRSQQESLEDAIAHRDLSEPPAVAGGPSAPAGVAGSPREISFSISRGKSVRKPEKKIPGVRRYVSSDGFEILVGRTSRDNDHLTFKVAKPNDLWLHAADYGGSHVVVRNSTRKDIPHRTIIEAAQLAAQFSQARKDPKVDVHYTQRKFVSKPRGSAPGLVRMTRFKNITVAPKEGVARI